MGVFNKLLGRKPATMTDSGAAVENPPCPHVTLIPKWDSTADMGHEDKATEYACEGCKGTFTAEQGRALRRTEAERVKHTLEA